jgi:hypothetical protein
MRPLRSTKRVPSYTYTVVYFAHSHSQLLQAFRQNLLNLLPVLRKVVDEIVPASVSSYSPHADSTYTYHILGSCSCFFSLFHAQSAIVNILELSIINATAPFEICISGGGCALAALNCAVVSEPSY